MSALPLRLPESELRDRLLWIGTGPGASADALAEICEIEEIPAGLGPAAILARQPDVVVARVEEGGLDLLRDLRRDRQARDLPVLLVGRSEERCLDALEEGASDVLAEPFSPRALAARVAAVLRDARARRESLLRERDLLAEAQMAAEALDRSEERFQAFLRNSPVASWMTDEEGRVLFLSEPYTRMFGIRLEDAIGRSPFDLYPHAFAQTFYDNVRAVAETNGTLETIEDAPRSDGTFGHFLVFKFPVRDASGRLLVGGVAADITEMKRAEEALRESEERFRLATEAVNGMIFDWSLATNAVQRSQGLLPLLGYWPEEVAGQLDWWKGRIHPEDVERVNGEIWGAIEGGRASFSTEYRALHRDGHWIHAWDKGLVVRDAEGKPVRVVGSTIDISDRQRAREELERAHREAQAANEAKDRFLATLSHELRTPLTPVLLRVAALARSPGLPEALRADLRMIQRNVELEAKLIDDLLDLTRVSRGKLSLHLEAVDVHALLEHTIAICSEGVEAGTLAIGLEPGATGRHVRADAARLQQVFWNLLKNAVKFTPAGGRIRVVTRNPEEERIEVSVIDPGIGIAPEDLPRLFNAFEQGNPAITRTFGGLGLGLAICKALVDQHGGTLTGLSPGRGRGATFTVSLATVPAPEAARPAGDAAGPADSRALRLLLVEDNEPTLQVMADLLELDGHDVKPAATVRAARELAERHTFDLVVSDLGLPDGSGFDLMRELRERYGLQGIAVSGFGMEEDLRRSREAGFHEHLVKPVDVDKLKAAIARAAEAAGTKP